MTPQIFTVLIRGEPVGVIVGIRRYPHLVSGVFHPGPGLEPYRSVFEAAVELAREFEETAMSNVCDYPLWDRRVLAWEEIARLGPTLAEAPVSIKEFSVEADWSVDVFLLRGDHQTGEA